MIRFACYTVRMRPASVLLLLALAAQPSFRQDNATKQSVATVPNLPDVNPQLLQLAIQDQSDRGNDLFSGKQLKTPPNLNVPKRDAERQAKVRTLLAEGKINSGRDYYFAALIFQHSETSENLLLAHILAVTSIAKGDQSGGWLSAATLDRYLWSIKHPQVFGTQYQKRADNRETMEPYDRMAISDRIRAAWGVNSLTQQEKAMNDSQNSDATAPPAKSPRP
ncbi:MAG: hypothetical protein WCA15_01935 [Candidatus Acidiferrales bacterium]